MKLLQVTYTKQVTSTVVLTPTLEHLWTMYRIMMNGSRHEGYTTEVRLRMSEDAIYYYRILKHLVQRELGAEEVTEIQLTEIITDLFERKPHEARTVRRQNGT